MASKPRLNILAIVVSAVVYFALAAVWFTVFMMRWLTGVGRTIEWLQATGVSPLLQYGVAFLASLVIGATIAWFVQATGEQTALRGMRIAGLLWFGFVLTTWSTEYVYEVRSLQTLAINAGFPLIGMVIQGAIVGGWKSKAKP